MKTLILGLGNTLLRDDGVGIRVAQELKKLLPPADGFSVMESSLWGLALIDLILGYDRVIILDAVKTGEYPVGDVHEIKLEKLRGLPKAPSPHYVGLPTLLKLGQELKLDMPSQIRVLGIEVADPYSFGEDFTPELKEVFPRIVSQIHKMINYRGGSDAAADSIHRKS